MSDPDQHSRFSAAWPPECDASAENVRLAMRDGSWSLYQGPWTERLRHRIADLHQVEFVRLCSSGTVAVELALRGVDVSAGDEVILGGYDFPGNFRCIEQLGALPVLVDIDPATGCLDPQHLESAYSPQTKAILVSHLHSGLAPMTEICAFAQSHHVSVVEDACQAPLAVVDGRTAGCWGDASVFSFGGSKLMTSGRGGAVITSDASCFQRMKIYSERGNDAYPLSELQAAVLLPQWDALDELNARRRKSATLITQGLRACGGLALCGPSRDDERQPSYYKFGIQLNDAIDRTEWIASCQAAGIMIDAGFPGFARRSARRCRRASHLSHAERAAQQTVVLHHPVLLRPSEVIDQLAAELARITNKG